MISPITHLEQKKDYFRDKKKKIILKSMVNMLV